MILNPILIWFLSGLVMAILEFAVPGVILIFFGVGAWIAALTTYLGLTGSFESQLLVFAVSSVLLIVFLRRYIKGKFYGHVSGVQDPDVNLDEFTGKSVIVLEDIIPDRQEGKVEFKGAVWSAVSDEHISKDEPAVITGVDGIILKVKKRKED